MSIEYLNKYGICIDRLYVKESILPYAGLGAYTKYAIKKGDVVTISPILLFDTSQMNIVLQQYKEKILHKILKPRKHYIEYQNHNVLDQQLLLNYCYGHPLYNILLLPIGSTIHFMNHYQNMFDSTNNHTSIKPNVMIRWSQSSKSLYNTSKKLINDDDYYTKSIIEIIDDTNYKPLFIEYIALRHILPNEELYIDYGIEWYHSYKLHDPNSNKKIRHPIGLPDDFFPSHWKKPRQRQRQQQSYSNNTNDIGQVNVQEVEDVEVLYHHYGDFITNSLKPGYIAPIRWYDTHEVVSPWGFRIGLNKKIRNVLWEYCYRTGIYDILSYVTKEGNSLLPGTDQLIQLNNKHIWYLQRPDPHYKSNSIGYHQVMIFHKMIIYKH